MFEIQTAAQLRAHLASGAPLTDTRITAVDLVPFEAELRARRTFTGTVVLGGRVPPTLDRHLRAQGALVFPADPAVPVDPYRAVLYSPDDLYAGLARGGYAATPDARAYAWATDAALARDTYVTMLRAIHDDAMGDALDEALDGHPVVGVMGGHQLRRGSPGYAAAAHLGHALADAGLVVTTGGGPGAMEAANLGAFARTVGSLDAGLERLAATPAYHPDVTAWAAAALAVRRDLCHEAPTEAEREEPGGGRPRSIGVPTWFYGHEPPNVFCDGIAKYFSNALREDSLVRRATAGTIVLPGAAGTVQEIFQAVTPLYYPPVGATLPPLVLVGVEQWTATVPVWDALRALGAGRPMGDAVHLVDTPQEAAGLVLDVAAGRPGPGVRPG